MTEPADKSLITLIKIVCEMKRATDLAYFYKRPEILIKLGPGKMP